MEMFDKWMKKQEHQAERNFPGHKERSTKAATWLIGGIAGAATIACLLAGLLLLFTMPLLGIFVLIATSVPYTIARLAFDKDYRTKMEARQ
jgi:Flp pilus assembly protein TadB